jgi:hypothetical protein
MSQESAAIPEVFPDKLFANFYFVNFSFARQLL